MPISSDIRQASRPATSAAVAVGTLSCLGAVTARLAVPPARHDGFEMPGIAPATVLFVTPVLPAFVPPPIGRCHAPPA